MSYLFVSDIFTEFKVLEKVFGIRILFTGSLILLENFIINIKKTWKIYFICFYEGLALNNKWTKIYLNEDFCLYYVGLSNDIISFCRGAWSFLLSTLVLQYWVKLLHAWMVSILSRTVTSLVKIFFSCFLLSYCLYLSRGREVCCCIEYRLCSTVVVLRCI